MQQNQRNNNFSGDRKMSASFGQPNQSERGQYNQPAMFNQVQSPVGANSAQHQFIVQSAQGSASQHARIPSEMMSASQRTEPAQNPAHIINMQVPAGVVNASNISRKQSDFSFASGSKQNGLNSGARSPRLPSQGSYANQFMERQQNQQQRAGSWSKRSNLNNSDSSRKNPKQSRVDATAVNQNMGGVSSQGSLISSSRYAKQQMMPSSNNIQSIQEEDNEMDYGTQVADSSSAPQQNPRDQTNSTQVNQFMVSANSTNMLSSTGYKPPQSHLQSLTVGSATLNPQIYSQDGTPTSGTHPLRYHQQNNHFQPPQPSGGAHRESLTINGCSIDTSSPSLNLVNLKLDHQIRYAELCERRILDYQPDHPLPVRDEHLGVVFANIDQNPTSDPRSNRSNSPSLPTTMRQGFVNRFDAGLDSASLNSGAPGSPRALKQHVDGLASKNHQLEVALRQETLANEEQRNYIQILKNVIEQKLERDGLLEMLKEAGRKKRAERQQQEFLNQQRRRASPSPEPVKQDEDAINLYVLLSDMKYQLDSKSKEVQRFIEQLKTQDEHSKAILDDNQRYQEELLQRNCEAEEISKRYQKFEDELSILHKQKEDLLDCVEVQVNQIESLKNDVTQERERSSTLELQIRQSQLHDYGRAGSQNSHYPGTQTTTEHPSPQLNPPQIISHPGDINIGEVTSQSLINNGIDLSYSRELTSEQNQTMGHHTQAQMTAEQHQQALQEQIQIVNQAAINAAQQSITQKASQESVASMSASYHGSTANLAIEQYQKHLQLKDQEIIRLRAQIDQISSEVFGKQQENDSLRFTESQLRKKLEMEQDRTNSQEEYRGKQLDTAQSKLYEEQRKIEDIQMHYESEVRKYQRELNVIREEQVEKDSTLEKIQKNYERQLKELELKEAQLESLRNQGSKDQTEIRELKTFYDEAKLDGDRLRKDRERRQDAELADGKTKEQLSREKNEVINQLSELQHQFEVFKTQKQTEAHRSDTSVRDASTRVEVLEKATKKQIVENEALQRDYTQTAVKLKQSEVQSGYLESSNKQLTDELRQTKLDHDSVNRDKQKLAVKIHDLEAQIETLSLRDGKNRKQYEQLTEAQLQLKSKDNEIEKLDDKLRKVYCQKEEFEVESIQLRKNVHELQISKNEFAYQRESLSGQTKDNERRIFDLVKDKQDNDKKIRENATVIRDLVEERDKFKRFVSDKDDEIQELSMQVKQWRSTNTDLKLIEEKVGHFLNEVKHVIQQSRYAARPQLQDFLRIVKASPSLSQRVSMRQREEGHDFLENLEQSERQTEQSADISEGAQSHLSHIWQTMLSVKQKIQEQGNLQEYFTQMLMQFVAENVDLNQQVMHNEHKVGNLEKKLGTIHSIDFKAQNDSQTLKKELLELKQRQLDEERRFQDEVEHLQQSLEQKAMSEKESTQEIRSLKKKLNQTLSETKNAYGTTSKTNKKIEKELWCVTAEKNRFEEVLEKIQETILGGTHAQTLVEEMKRCSKTLANADTDKETLLREIDELELRLAEVNTDQQDKPNDNSQKIRAITKVKNLRSEMTLKEERIRDIDERLSMEADRLTVLGNQLQLMNPISTISNTQNTQQQTLQSNRPTHQRNLSMSPHRQQRDVSGEAHTPFERTGQSGFSRGQQQEPYTTSNIPRFDRADASYHQRGAEDHPQRDSFCANRDQEQRSNRSYRMSAYGAEQIQQNQDVTISSNTQQLNTHAMARLLKETKEMRRGRDSSNHQGSQNEMREGSSGRVPVRLQPQHKVAHETTIRQYSQQEHQMK